MPKRREPSRHRSIISRNAVQRYLAAAADVATSGRGKRLAERHLDHRLPVYDDTQLLFVPILRQLRLAVARTPPGKRLGEFGLM